MPKVTLKKDGSVFFDIKEIEKVSIESIKDVVIHNIKTIEDKVIHELEFINNSKCHLFYSLDGKLLGMKATNLAITLEENGNLILRMSEKLTCPTDYIHTTSETRSIH